MFAASSPHEVFPFTFGGCFGGEKWRVEHDILDIASTQLELISQKAKISSRVKRGFDGESTPPNFQAIRLLRHREFDSPVQAANKGVVQVLAKVGRQDYDAIV